MAKSIRVSEGMYELASSACTTFSRSLAEQIEHWASLGAAFDAAGLTLEQATHLLKGDEHLKAKILAHVLKSKTSRSPAQSEGARSINERKRGIEAAVREGKRSPESLFLLSKEQVKAAKFTERWTQPEGAGW